MAKLMRLLLCLVLILSLISSFMLGIIRIPQVHGAGEWDWTFHSEVAWKSQAKWTNNTSLTINDPFDDYTWEVTDDIDDFWINTSLYEGYAGDIYGFRHRYRINVTQAVYNDELALFCEDTVNLDDIGLYVNKVDADTYKYKHRFGNTKYEGGSSGGMELHSHYTVYRYGYWNESSDTFAQRVEVYDIPDNELVTSCNYAIINPANAWSGGLNYSVDGMDFLWVFTIGYQAIWEPLGKINVTIECRQLPENITLSMPIKWNSVTYTSTFSQVIFPSTISLMAPDERGMNKTHHHHFSYWSDNSRNPEIEKDFQSTQTFIAYYTYSEKWDPAGASNFLIGLIGLILIFLSWIFLRIYWKDGEYGKALGMWLCCIVIGIPLFTVMLGG